MSPIVRSKARRGARAVAAGVLGGAALVGVLGATAAPASAQICIELINIPLGSCPPPAPPSSAPAAPAPAPAPADTPAQAPAGAAPASPTPAPAAATPVAPASAQGNQRSSGSATSPADPEAPAAPASESPRPGNPPGGTPVESESPAEAVGRITTAVAGTVAEPRILVTALTLALGLGVLAGASRQVPRYRRRQRRLLAAWNEAADHERATAVRLAEATRQKNDFLALVSHELRTPLTAVKGFLDTVLVHWDRLPEDRRRELLDRVSNNADELTRLVSQLLEFARSDTGPVEVLPEPLDVRVEVTSALRDLAPVVAHHHVELDIPDDMTVMADRDGFGHVLVNLLTNAVKFSPAGSCVRVRAHGDGDDVVVAVVDEGPGIAPAEQARVFDRFYQANNGTGAHRGTGIGLTIAQRFTELQGGHIWVESEPGCGATFAFTMPRADVRAYA